MAKKIKDETKEQYKRPYYGGGRKAGQRSEAYELAGQEYFLKGTRITDLAKKYGIDRTGLSTYINSTKKDAEKEFGEIDISEVAKETQSAVLSGFKNIEAMQKSTNPVINAVAENIIEKIKTTNLTLARNIQLIGGRVLKDLSDEVESLRAGGKMNLHNINQAFDALQKANNVLGIPKTPTQINILNQNNQNNGAGGSNASNMVKISVTLKKDINFKSQENQDIVVDSKDIE